MPVSAQTSSSQIMRIIDSIDVMSSRGKSKIELLHGDLSRIPAEHAVDLLFVSAFPNDYSPTPSSLIGSLCRHGVSVENLARQKEVDLRATCSCWLSADLGSLTSSLHFKKILCFEPVLRAKPAEVIGDIFRAIIPFTGGNPPLRSVAMPILATGDQRWPISDILPPLVSAAHHWLAAGLALESIKIVVYREQDLDQASSEFLRAKTSIQNALSIPQEPKLYDVFISYCRDNRTGGNAVRNCLQKENISVFIDEQAIDRGASWQQKIFDALESCSKFVALYSPSYLLSKVCQEEFNIAWARNREAEKPIIFPMYWENCELPTHMKILNYFDCRERSEARVASACEPLIEELRCQ